MSNSRSLGSVNELQARFKRQFELDQKFRVEDILGSSSQSSTFSAHELAELIALEIKLRQAAGQSLDRSEYFDRFDGQAHTIELQFKNCADENSRCSSSQNRNGEAVASRFTADSNYARDIPERIGQYELHQTLGEGSFGIVFRATDTSTGATVALKFPRERVLKTAEHLRQFYQEAEASRTLEHPAIVRTLAVEDIDGYLFLVQQYVDGPDLGSLRDSGASVQTIVKVLTQIADALAHAHQLGYLHRDLKPTNILLAESNQPRIVDFGLAVHESTQRSSKGQRCGSVDYMSPEMVQGLSHQLDSRSDIWSVGVCMYYLLSGRKPFNGETRDEIFEEIKNLDARPLRMLNPEIDAELQRICLRCLNKRKKDRYPTADELAEDLRAWLQTPVHSQVEAPIVPKGIRSFDAEDSDFFIRLLPGPTDRHGFPASIRFWKTRIERTEGDVVPVGVIFGSSGCGKSSFIKAGLLPHISDSVTPIYIESTAADTESRLARAICNRFEALPKDLPLPALLRTLHEHLVETGGPKVLIVLDQFEQWLHASSKEQENMLIEAVRICDGVHLQCILTIRDDFWVKISSFVDELDVSLKENENLLRLDRFTTKHARKILAEFGRAYDCLPWDLVDLSKEQNQFLDEAIEQLAEEDRVTSVRLSLLAEMFKDRTWSRQELQRVGGVSGIGETYLQETFSSKDAKPEYRRFSEPVQRILEALLPPVGQEIRDHMRSREQLAENVALAKPMEFESVLRILNVDTSLIAPTDPESLRPIDSANDSQSENEYFQLTHDYMVPSIRTWLNRKKRESWQGRARLRLDELADHYQRGRDAKFVPSLDELARIRWAVPNTHYNEAHRELLSVANRKHGIRLAIVGLMLAVIVGCFASLYRSNRVGQAEAALKKYLECPSHRLPLELANLKPYAPYFQGDLERAAQNESHKIRMRAIVATRHFYKQESLLSWAGSNGMLEQLIDEFTSLPDRKLDRFEFAHIISSLLHDREKAAEAISEGFNAEKSNQCKARLALASLILDDSRPAEALLTNVKNPTAATLMIHDLPQYWPKERSLVNVVESLVKTSNIETDDALDGTVDDGLSSEAAANRFDGLLYALFVSAGEIDVSEIPKEEFEAWARIIKQQFAHNPNSAVHSACFYLANKWQIKDMPKLEPTSRPREGYDWWVVEIMPGHEMTFARVKTGEFPCGKNSRIDFKEQIADNLIKIDTSFWLATTEVTNKLIRNWLDEDPGSTVHQVIANIKKASRKFYFLEEANSRFPSINLTPQEYQQFVNYLNRNSETDIKFKFAVPDTHQWEYCCRAGSETAFYWGEYILGNMAEKYGVYENIRLDDPVAYLEAPGSRIPNRWGFLDIVGNAAELTLNPDVKQNNVIIRGGNTTEVQNYVSGNNGLNIPTAFRSGTFSVRLLLEEQVP